MASLVDVYIKEEELLANQVSNESSQSWQRYGSSLVANTILIAAAGVLLSARSTATVEFALRFVATVLGLVGMILNYIFYRILIRSRAIVRSRCVQLAEVERIIKNAVTGNPTGGGPYLIWDEGEYNRVLNGELAKTPDSRQIMTMMTWLPLLFIVLFSTIAVAGSILAYSLACRVLCWG